MPKKGRKNNSVIKQKKAIETRLIQISLIMDDYLYKHKQVSEHDAESYIVEISSFIKKCNNDPRSLQVIEKLIRFMKAIMNEQKQIRETISIDSNTKEITSQAVCVSPVYSLGDDVKEYFTQSILEENSATLMKINNCDEIKDLSEVIGNQHCQESNNATENDYGTKSMLDLIVLDSEDEETEINNSQNILNNYPGVASQDLFNTYTQDENQTTIINNCHDIPREPPGKKELSNGSQTSNNFTEMDYSQTILTNSGYVEDLLNFQTQLDTIPNSQNIIDKSERLESEVISNALPKELVNNQTTKVNLKETKEEFQKLVNLTANKLPSLHLDNSDIPVYYLTKPIAKSVTNIGDVNKNKKDPRKQKINVKAENNAKTKEVKRKPRKKKDQVKTNTHKVSVDTNKNSSLSYENTVDLSWVESLNYVREISTTENHTRSNDLSLSFWENYSLPNDWDDSEFEYKT